MPTKRSAALAAPPAFIVPSKPKRHPRPPSGERWWHEVKFDGYRIGLRLDRGTVTVLSSRGNDFSSKAGLAIAIAIKALPMRSAYLDGELVVEAEDGLTDFGLLQAELGARRR